MNVTALLARLRAADPADRPAMIFDEAVEQGGTYDPTPGAVEIAMHGAHVHATRLDDAIAAWMAGAHTAASRPSHATDRQEPRP